ncbi:hypothetical protein ACFLSE_04730 [Bacteroidota bacterium]
MKTKITRTIKATLLLTFIYSNLLFASSSDNEKELEAFLNKIEIKYEKIAFELGDAYWNFYSAEAEADLKTPKDKFYNLLINDTLNTLIETWYPKLIEIQDTILQRRVHTWHRVLISAKVEYNDEIMQLRNELEEMLEVSGDAKKPKGDFSEKMLKLIELRNKKAVELGYDNYVHLTFEINGIGYEWFINFIDQMDKATIEPYKALVENMKTTQDLKEFGQKDAFQFIGLYYRNNEPTELKNDNNIEMVKVSLANIGINYDDLPAKLVEKQLPPGVGGQGLMINIPYDFRAVMTLGMEISTWMHEMGHGLHGLYNSIDEPILEGYEWIPGNANPSFCEGMAETSAWLTRNYEWQKEYTNLTEDQIKEKQDALNQVAPAYIRFQILNFMRETELYLHPEKSYEEIQIELAKKYLLIESDKIRTQNLENIIYVSYPLYLQNYLIADMVACQVHRTLEEKFGNEYAFNKDVGKYLIKNFYSTGEYYGWNDRLIKGTGKPLDIEAYLQFYKIK